MGSSSLKTEPLKGSDELSEQTRLEKSEVQPADENNQQEKKRQEVRSVTQDKGVKFREGRTPPRISI